MQEQKSEADTALERLIFLSDGVFAIAITLLVLQITVPTSQLPARNPDATLVGLLGGLWQPTLTYALSFVIIGQYWISHQRIFRFIKRTDSRLTWFNIFFLMSVAFLPIPTKVLNQYGNHQAAAVFYAASLAIGGVWLAVIWWYATHHHRLVEKQLDPALIRYYQQRIVVTPIVFTGSIAVSFLSPGLAEASWTLVFVAITIQERLYRRQAAKRVAQPVAPSQREAP